jgi:hypothetical protein
VTDDETEPAGSAGAGDAGADDATGQPGDLLGELATLRHRVRATRHAYWFPLVLFGLIGIGAVPFYLLSAPPGVTGRSAWTVVAPATPVLAGNGISSLGRGSSLLGFYWLLALVAGFLLMMAWYRRHARQAGVTSPVRPAAITGIALTIVALIGPAIARAVGSQWLWLPFPWFLTIHGMYPFLIIGISLCVLARSERSRALTLIAIVYLAAAVVACSYDVENQVARFGYYTSANWFMVLPNAALPVGVLLLSGATASLYRRRVVTA